MDQTKSRMVRRSAVFGVGGGTYGQMDLAVAVKELELDFPCVP